jgi:hypothetical protein
MGVLSCVCLDAYANDLCQNEADIGSVRVGWRRAVGVSSGWPQARMM